jgi:hypothetical protein
MARNAINCTGERLVATNIKPRWYSSISKKSKLHLYKVQPPHPFFPREIITDRTFFKQEHAEDTGIWLQRGLLLGYKWVTDMYPLS